MHKSTFWAISMSKASTKLSHFDKKSSFKVKRAAGKIHEILSLHSKNNV